MDTVKRKNTKNYPGYKKILDFNKITKIPVNKFVKFQIQKNHSALEIFPVHF